MPIEINVIEKLLLQKIPDADIKIVDLLNDQNHYSLEIKSSIFKDKSRIEQHRIVNTALQTCLGSDLHALQIKTIVKD